MNIAQRVFDESKREKEIKRRAEELELERDEMLKTTGYNLGRIDLSRGFSILHSPVIKVNGKQLL